MVGIARCSIREHATKCTCFQCLRGPRSNIIKKNPTLSKIQRLYNITRHMIILKKNFKMNLGTICCFAFMNNHCESTNGLGYSYVRTIILNGVVSCSVITSDAILPALYHWKWLTRPGEISLLPRQ